MNQHCHGKTQLMIALIVLIFASLTFGQEGVPLFTKDFTPEEFAKRRSAVYDAIGANTLAVVQGAPAPVGYVRFRQSNEYYYLCGIEVPHAYLLLDGSQRHASLYLPHRNEGRERSEGHFVDLLRSRFPHFEINNLTPILDQLRLIKSPAEMALIRKATQLSGWALMEGMRSTKPGLFEYELDAMAKFVYYRNGAQGEAYYSLIASASNAWYPHYNAGRRQMQDGDFMLMDFAPDVGYYMSDVTRMWPVNGKFNAWQRELYDFYLGCYQAILQAIRPGVNASAIKQEASKVMEDILKQAKFSKPHYEKAGREFVESYRAAAGNPETYMGHWVGMATHDVGTHTGPLQPGMVFTIAPASKK